jgi:hypothetical protein
MNTLKKRTAHDGRYLAALLILLVVLACGFCVQATSDLPEVHPALRASLAFGIVN